MTFPKILLGVLVLSAAACNANGPNSTRSSSTNAMSGDSSMMDRSPASAARDEISETIVIWNYETPSSDQVRRLQSALNSNGANLVEDGIIGSRTRAALRDYQRRNSLTASGRIDEATVNSLGLGRTPSRAPSSVPGVVQPEQNPMNRPSGPVNPGGATNPGGETPMSTPGTSETPVY